MVYVPYLLLRHPIQTPCQIGSFFWNRPIRALTSTAISGAVIGGITSAFSKFSTPTSASLNPRTTVIGFHSLGARDLGRSAFHTLELTPETYAMFHGDAVKNVVTVTPIVDSPFSTTILARTGAITSATVISLPQNNLNKEKNCVQFGNRRVQIAKVFQDEDHRLLSMNAETFFKTIDQAILDNKEEIKEFVSCCKS